MLEEHDEEVPEKEDEEKEEEEDEETLREGKSPKHGTRPKLQGVKVYK
tara:strand:+ start:734 stop:877 length:144 start_codon:yes stop_codon:yes gene_type:complete